MTKKKICMLGAFAVGKTSLVNQFVRSLFSEKYHTTIGVKVDKKEMTVQGTDVALLLWDIHGKDDIQELPSAYLWGAAGYLLVADGTHRATLGVAESIQKVVTDTVGALPFMLLLNKSDLAEQWEIGSEDMGGLADRGWPVVKTSAKTGEGVESAFLALARRML
jgi:small GTP-binding protein